MCVLGYCVFPIDIAAIVAGLVNWPVILKLAMAGAATGWATFASYGFITNLIQEDKKILALYPVLLFYLFLGWFIIIV